MWQCGAALLAIDKTNCRTTRKRYYEISLTKHSYISLHFTCLFRSSRTAVLLSALSIASMFEAKSCCYTERKRWTTRRKNKINPMKKPPKTPRACRLESTSSSCIRFWIKRAIRLSRYRTSRSSKKFFLD